MGAKAVTGEPTLDGKPAPTRDGQRHGLDVHCIQHMGEVRKWRASCLTAGVQGNLGVASHETEGGEVKLVFMFGPGVGRWRAVVLLVGESLGVERHEPEGRQGACGALVAVGPTGV